VIEGTSGEKKDYTIQNVLKNDARIKSSKSIFHTKIPK
jgi:hypothetical protein